LKKAFESGARRFPKYSKKGRKRGEKGIRRILFQNGIRQGFEKILMMDFKECFRENSTGLKFDLCAFGVYWQQHEHPELFPL
jgi:hypothetical protein